MKIHECVENEFTNPKCDVGGGSYNIGYGAGSAETLGGFTGA